MNGIISLEFKAGIRTALADGTLVFNSPKHMATEELYKAKKGSKLSLHSGEYLYAVAIFSLDRDMTYIYTYSYQCESNWTSYQKNLSPDSYTTEQFLFEEECYFRICLKRKDGQDITQIDAQKGSEYLRFETFEEVPEIKKCFELEIDKTARDILNVMKQSEVVSVEKKLKFCVLTDTHYTVNGTWEDTALNIQAVHEKVHFDEIIHLGDVTDGVTSAKITAKFSEKVLGDLYSCSVPVRMVLGNHDSNYFHNNKEKFSLKQQIDLYLRNNIKQSVPYYYIDYSEFGLRCLFLHSFDDTNPIRYGFSEEEVTWVAETLCNMQGGNVLIFAHEAPIATLDYWSYLIRNGRKLMEILEEYNSKEEYHILGYFYGHTHADSIYSNFSFPLVSIACAKCEYFTEKKPKGANVPERQLNTVTQDCWDTLIVDIEKEKIYMIRFGAGEDRIIDCSKTKSVYSVLVSEKKRNRRTQIWAHRGASSYAPENTLPAFALAMELGSDGVELDVQLTKDGIPVVIHDETIDRVSDGKGYVRDYTLKELKQFNFNMKFPLYGRTELPTLEEVFIMLQDTELTVNIELKNHRIFYAGLVEKVLDIVLKYKMEGRVIYSSFNHMSLLHLKQLNPDSKTAFLCRDGFIDIAGYTRKNDAYAIHPELINLQYPQFLNNCRRNEIKVHVWTVDAIEDITRMVAEGVDAIITNYPDKAIEISEEYCSS